MLANSLSVEDEEAVQVELRVLQGETVRRCYRRDDKAFNNL